MCLHICRVVYLFLTIFSEPYTEIMGDSPGSTLYIDIRLESFLNYLCWVEYSWEVRLYHFHMRNLFWDEVCISLKHMDNVSFQCWISQIEIVECAFQRGFKMCKIYNFVVAHKGRHQWEKNVFFRALPESPKPPPLTPIRATWSSFFRTSKLKMWKSNEDWKYTRKALLILEVFWPIFQCPKKLR